jgi:hypothetical protein
VNVPAFPWLAAALGLLAGCQRIAPLDPLPQRDGGDAATPLVDSGADGDPTEVGAGGDAGDGGAPNDGGRVWSTPTVVEHGQADDDHAPSLAVDDQGNAIVVWVRGGDIWFNRYDAGVGAWGQESPLGGAQGDSPRVSVDGAGVATAIWRGAPGTIDARIWAATTSGTGWIAPVPVSTGGRVVSPQLAVGGDGTAIAAWEENNLVGGDNQYVLWGSSRPPGGNWTAPIAFREAYDLGDRRARLGLDGTGRGFVIWEQLEPPSGPTFSDVSVHMSRFENGRFADWALLDDYVGGYAERPRLAVAAGGDAVAVWRQKGTSRQELWGRRFVAGTWRAPEMIAFGSVVAATEQSPNVAIDADGNCVVAWSRGAVGSRFNTYVSRRPVEGSAWDAAQALEDDNFASGVDDLKDASPVVGIDGAGSATIVWRKVTAADTTQLWGRRLALAGTLLDPARIDETDIDDLDAHQVVVSGDGAAIAVWYHARDIWSSTRR